MRKRLTRKAKNKRNKQIILCSLIGIIVLMASGYAAFSTSLSLRAKGNIVERMTPEKLKNDFCNTESGDGLYKDIYEEGKCFYKGINPNNYITFNNETWRIISIEPDNTIKIMRNQSIGKHKWGGMDYNDWEISSLKTYLNGDYLNFITVNKDKIVPHTWSIGTVLDGNNDLAGQIISENGTQSQSANVGMITVSEYLRANSNIEQCGSITLNNNNNSICGTTNWITNIDLNNTWKWTISPEDGEYSYGFTILSFSSEVRTTPCMFNYDIYPALYLSSDITLSGTGTEKDSYVITN